MVVLTSFTQPTDGIRHRQQNTVVYVNNNNLGKGTLYIAESRLSWISETGNGFSIEYPHIALHAISRDLSAFPQECLFLMLDTPLADDNDQNNEEDEDVEGDDSNQHGTTEMRLVPDDRGMLDAMFHAMNECQALHPDPEDSFSDEDFFEDADDESPMEEADYQMARLRIGNMDGRAHMEDMVEGRVGGMRECILGGMGEDRVGDRVGVLRESMALDILGGMEGDMEVGMEEGMVEGTSHILGGKEGDMEVGMEEGMVGGMVGGMVEGTSHISGGREGDMEVGMEEGMVEGTSHISGGREEGMGAGMVVGREAGRGAGTVEGTSHISGGREEGMVGGREAGTVEGTSRISGGREEAGLKGISQRDRSLLLGNMSHQDSSAGLPLAHSPHTVLERHLDDAEN